MVQERTDYFLFLLLPLRSPCQILSHSCFSGCTSHENILPQRSFAKVVQVRRVRGFHKRRGSVGIPVLDHFRKGLLHVFVRVGYYRRFKHSAVGVYIGN